MIPIRYLISTVCIALCLSCSPPDLIAQRQVGIRWEVPDGVQQAERELELIHELGFTHLEVNRTLPSSIWKKIEQMDLQIFGSLPVQFPLPHTFSRPDSAFLETISGLITHYAGQPSVQAIGLFQYGLTNNDRFTNALTQYVRQIREIYPGRLYYLASRPTSVASDQLFDFKMVSTKVTGKSPSSGLTLPDRSGSIIYYYDPPEQADLRLAPVKLFLEETSSVPTPVFFDSQWLLKILEAYPEFRHTIELYTSDPEPVFATPSEKAPTASPHSPIVLLLILVWTVFAVNYSFNPIFRRSLFRYFTAHRFYVEDIMRRHIRSLSPAAIILLLHGLLAGIAVYCFMSISFSGLGIEALSHHLPALLTGDNFLISIVIAGIILTLAFEAVCIIWLLLANAHIHKMGQAVNLYAIPLHLNLIIATVMVTLLTAGGQSLAVTILGILFLLVFFLSFIMTSIDTARYVRVKHLYLLGTGIAYAAAVGAAVIWALNNPSVTDAYRLALWLS